MVRVDGPEAGAATVLRRPWWAAQPWECGARPWDPVRLVHADDGVLRLEESVRQRGLARASHSARVTA